MCSLDLVLWHILHWRLPEGGDHAHFVQLDPSTQHCGQYLLNGWIPTMVLQGRQDYPYCIDDETEFSEKA